ncbi:hypothetical protein EON67_01095 [archaeon]|nr:MAG: hypothetical protein EON67_01095 [archaeon]
MRTPESVPVHCGVQTAEVLQRAQADEQMTSQQSLAATEAEEALTLLRQQKEILETRIAEVTDQVCECARACKRTDVRALGTGPNALHSGRVCPLCRAVDVCGTRSGAHAGRECRIEECETCLRWHCAQRMGAREPCNSSRTCARDADVCARREARGAGACAPCSPSPPWYARTVHPNTSDLQMDAERVRTGELLTTVDGVLNGVSNAEVVEQVANIKKLCAKAIAVCKERVESVSEELARLREEESTNGVTMNSCFSSVETYMSYTRMLAWKLQGE